MKKITSISYLRGLSAILIFACHVAFIAGAFEVSMWLNTGVPIFFIISAYLLAIKSGYTGIAPFYKRRIKSIFPSYVIYIACIVIALFAIGRAPTVKSILCYCLGLSGFTSSCILGLGHLWFISVLLVCYLITPFLQRLCQTHRRRRLIASIVTIIAVQFILFLLCGHPSYGIHVASYIFVYCFYNIHHGIVSKKQVVVWSIAAAALILMRLLLDRQFMASDYEIYYYYDAIFQPIARFGLAMCVFAIFVYHSEAIENWSDKNSRAHRIISKFSDCSYEVYLTHQFILLGFWEFFPCLHSRGGE